MATGISSAERLPEGDYSVSHRTPPPVPGLAYANTAVQPPPQLLNEPGRPGKVSDEAASLSSEGRHHRRRGSFSSLLRRSSSQPRTAQTTSDDVPPVPALPPAPTTRIGEAHQAAAKERATSFSVNRKVSIEGGRTMLRKSSKLRAQQEAQRQEEERIARQNAPAPRLPSHNPLPGIASFGGDQYTNTNTNRPNFSRPGQSNSTMPGYANSNNNNNSSSPAYQVRAASSPKPSGEYVEGHESMTNRGRYSYASSTVGVNVNSPRRVRRRKDPTPFNVLVIGAKNSGKTSFISFLRHSLALSPAKAVTAEPDETISSSKSSFTSHYLETEMDGERVGLTLYDSAGLEKNIVDLQLREMAAFVEEKFEETFVEEQKVMRSPGVKDTHVHCVLLILDPVRLDANIAASQQRNSTFANISGLDDDLDLQVMRSLWGKTTVIPVISKADTLTVGHMAFLKRAVWQSIRAAKVDPLEALELEDDSISEENESDLDNDNDSSDPNLDYSPSKSKANRKSASHRRHSSLQQASSSTSDDGNETPYIPMSILSPDPYDLPPYNPTPSTNGSGPKKPASLVRRFAWGVADPMNATHCDFTRLRDSIFLEWRAELRELSRTRWYEGWRTSRLRNAPGGASRKGKVSSSAGSQAGAGAVPRAIGGFSPAERVMGAGAGASMGDGGRVQAVN